MGITIRNDINGRPKIKDGRPVHDLVGNRYGRLTVVDFAYRKLSESNGKLVTTMYWLCQCDCGNKTIARGSKLKSGRTKSCGCLKKEMCASFGERSFIPEHHPARLYKVWNGLINRCNNPKNKAYRNYGGRGISVCEEWEKSFVVFREWALANGYDANAKRGLCTIDRINNNGNYEPSNCRWVDMKVQNNNRRDNKGARL